MDRIIVQFGALPLDTDMLQTNKNAMVGVGMALAALFGAGNTGPYVDGLACAPGSGLSVNVGPGSIYVQAAIDDTAYGSLPLDTTDQIIQQGLAFGQTVLNCPAPAAAGQSINYLIEAQFQQIDTNPVALLYYNSANPLQPLTGSATNTTRSGVCALQIKAGTAAATSMQTTPAADSGWTGLYVVTVAHGATSVVSWNISAVSGAPILAGLLNSHHGGVPGQAPKINLASEVQGTLQVANLPVIPMSLLPSGLTVWCGTSTGSANAQILTPSPALPSFPAGAAVAWQAGFSNTGAITITIAGAYGPFPLRKDGPAGPVTVPAGQIVAGTLYTCRLDASGTFLQLSDTELGTAAQLNASDQIGGVSATQSYAGNPNGNLAGNAAVVGISAPSTCWDTVDGILWTCITTGSTSTAVWSKFAPVTGQDIYIATSQALAPGIYDVDTSVAPISLTLEATANSGDNYTFNDVAGTFGTNQVNIVAAGTYTFDYGATTYILNRPYTQARFTLKSGIWSAI